MTASYKVAAQLSELKVHTLPFIFDLIADV